MPYINPMVQTTSFLPDNKPVLCSVLAHLPYNCEEMVKIASGTDPSLFTITPYSITVWGLLYLGEEELGFFIHASKSPMAALFSSTAKAESANPIHFHVPYASITSAEIIRMENPKTVFGKFCSWFILKKEDRFELTWDGGFRLEFFLTTDCAEFEKTLAGRLN